MTGVVGIVAVPTIIIRLAGTPSVKSLFGERITAMCYSHNIAIPFPAAPAIYPCPTHPVDRNVRVVEPTNAVVNVDPDANSEVSTEPNENIGRMSGFAVQQR
jgi:hypothetical protein